MTKLSIQEVKMIELQILDYIDRVCRENNLTYFLAWGTLLGAVRHKGFIPWDDDIDLLMPRKDYEELSKLINNTNSPYKYLSYNTDKEYHYLFAKVVDNTTVVVENNTLQPQNMGVWVDIFPLDYLPDNESLCKKVQQKCWNYRQIWGHALVWKIHKNSRGLIYNLGCFLCYLYGGRRAIKRFHQLAQTSNIQTNYVSQLVDCNSKYEKMPSSWFSSSIQMEFEGSFYPVPIGYKNYLEVCFGDYMKLPPIEQRVSNHSFEAYRKQ